MACSDCVVSWGVCLWIVSFVHLWISVATAASIVGTVLAFRHTESEPFGVGHSYHQLLAESTGKRIGLL